MSAHGSRRDAGASGPHRPLPERPSLEQLRKQAKDLLRSARAGDTGSFARIATG